MLRGPMAASLPGLVTVVNHNSDAGSRLSKINCDGKIRAKSLSKNELAEMSRWDCQTAVQVTILVSLLVPIFLRSSTREEDLAVRFV